MQNLIVIIVDLSCTSQIYFPSPDFPVLHHSGNWILCPSRV